MASSRKLPYRLSDSAHALAGGDVLDPDVLALALVLAPLGLAAVVMRLARGEALGAGDTLGFLIALLAVWGALLPVRGRGPSVAGR